MLAARPAEGTMLVKFKRTNENKSTDAKGKTRYSVGLDITEITEVEAPKEECSKCRSTSEVLDEYAKETPSERREREGEIL